MQPSVGMSEIELDPAGRGVVMMLADVEGLARPKVISVRTLRARIEESGTEAPAEMPGVMQSIFGGFVHLE